MTLSNNLHSFNDIHEILTAAVAHGGGRITLKTKGKAFYWKARANHYRALLHKTQKAQGVVVTSTPFDKFVVRLDPDEKNVILIVEQKFDYGTFEDFDGNLIDTVAFRTDTPEEQHILTALPSEGFDVTTDEELIEAANAARKSLFGDES